MQYFIEFLSLCLLVFCIYSLLKKRITIPILIVIGYYVFSDFMSFFAGYRIGQISVWKLFLDILYIFVFLYLFVIYLTKLNHKRATSIREAAYYSLVLISVLLIPIGVINNGFVSSVSGWRAIFLPIFLAEGLLLISKQRADIEGDMKRLINCIIVFAVVNATAGIYQYISYNGDYTSVWRFDLLLEAKLAANNDFLEHFMQYQIERGGELRASGFMVSALGASYFCALGALSVLYKLYSEKKKLHFKLLYGVVFILLIGGVYVSQVRTSLMVILLFPVISYVVALVKYKTYAVIIFIVGMLVAVGIASMLLQGVLDASALGRVEQYKILINDSSLMGGGLGSYLATFDSYYIHVFMAIGIFGVLPVWYFLSKVVKVASFIREDRGNGLLKISLILSIIMFLVCFVQHTASSLYYFISLLVLFGAAGYGADRSKFKAVGGSTSL